jgi:broad specificity phosphatase PhoE
VSDAQQLDPGHTDTEPTPETSTDAVVGGSTPATLESAATNGRGGAAAGAAHPAGDTPDAATAGTGSESPAATERVQFGGERRTAGRTSDPARTLPGDVAAGTETIVHIMRHGEVHNPKGILYGRLPGFSLSVTGRSQAVAVARVLADHDIALVVASPLQRAQETAEPIAAQHGVIVRSDDNLIEAGNTFEGLRVSVGDGALRKPRHWWKLRDPFTPSWGEPYLQIAHRMLAAVNKARVEAAGHEVVLVSHQLPVWTLRRFLEGKRLWHDPRNRQCALASLTSLVYQGETLIDIVYSEPAGGSDPRVTGA